MLWGAFLDFSIKRMDKKTAETKLVKGMSEVFETFVGFFPSFQSKINQQIKLNVRFFTHSAH